MVCTVRGERQITCFVIAHFQKIRRPRTEPFFWTLEEVVVDLHNILPKSPMTPQNWLSHF